jgi:hypothetical protein
LIPRYDRWEDVRDAPNDRYVYDDVYVKMKLTTKNENEGAEVRRRGKTKTRCRSLGEDA